MSSGPIYDALTVLRRAIFQALDPLTTAGVYWMQAKQGALLPYVIYQSQDGGGQPTQYVGALGWQGLITVRALASDQSAAEALLEQVRPGMDALMVPGYSVAVRHEKPMPPMTTEGTWQAGHIWRVTIGA